MKVSIDGSLPIYVAARTEEKAIEMAVRDAHERGLDHITKDDVEVIE